MKNGFLNKIFPFLMSLILVINLILIPKIDSFADVNRQPISSSFIYSYNGLNFYFDVSNTSTPIPSGYMIDYSVLDSICAAELSADNMRIANAGYIISSISNFAADIYSLSLNAFLTLGQNALGLFTDVNNVYLYTFNLDYIGPSPSLSGRHIFNFSTVNGDNTVVLDDSGSLPAPSDHTYTSHDSVVISEIIDNQIDPSEGEVYIPRIQISDFNDLPKPYIDGKSLHFFIRHDATYIQPHFVIDDFTDTFTALNTLRNNNNGYYNTYFKFFSLEHSLSAQQLVEGNNYFYVTTNNNSTGYLNTNPYYPSGLYNGYYLEIAWGSYVRYTASSNFPSYNGLSGYGLPDNQLGIFENTIQQGTSYLYLRSVHYNPVSNPTDINLPYEEPVPVEPIIDWPDDNLPDDDPDGDPTEITPVGPTPPPLPDIFPPIPSVVSGNDDLWPELNITFDIEDDLIGLANPLINFQWPSFSSIISSFLDSIVWVSSIMTALFNGSDYNVLFSVLSIFFIAASIFGLYKWWHR